MFRFDLSKQSLPVVGTNSPNVWICMQSLTPSISYVFPRASLAVHLTLVACPDINKLFSSSARHSWVIKYMAHGLTRRYNLILTCGFLFLRCFFKTIERASDLCLSLLPTIIISVVSVIKVRIFVSSVNYDRP